MPLKIEPLGKHHDRAAFTSGSLILDDWFRHRATQDSRRDIARVFVASDEHGIIGFYSLGAFSLKVADLPQILAKKLPRYEEIPAALIGRLARHERVRGQGIGDLLLADAVRRVLAAAQTLAAFAVVVDAKDAAAVAFYRGRGFQPFPLRPTRLFLPLSTAIRALEK